MWDEESNSHLAVHENVKTKSEDVRFWNRQVCIWKTDVSHHLFCYWVLYKYWFYQNILIKPIYVSAHIWCQICSSTDNNIPERRVGPIWKIILKMKFDFSSDNTVLWIRCWVVESLMTFVFNHTKSLLRKSNECAISC